MNSMDADGEKAGFDLELNRRLATELPVPIIASGGAGTMQDFKDVFDVGVDAALAASVFHFGQIDIPRFEDLFTGTGNSHERGRRINGKCIDERH